MIEDSGFAIKTSTTTAYGIMYDPVGDGVKIGLGSFDENGKFIYDEGEAQFLATRADNITDGNLPQWDNEKKQFVDSGKKIGDFLQKKNDIYPDGNGYYVYAIDRKGNNILLGASYHETGGLAVRSLLGHIRVPDLTETDYEGFAVNKKYVKDGFVAKQNPEFDSGATRGYVYFIDVNGNQTVVKAQIQAIASGTIPIRDSNYNFYVGNPKQPQHCTPKQYVDNLPDNLTLTDDEKAKWADFVGAVKAITTADPTYRQMYMVDKDGNQVAVKVANYGTPVGNTIVMSGNNGNITVNPTPQMYNDATAKRYVDNLPDYLALTENTTDENGEVVQGTKTKWQDWLGVNSLIAEVAEEVKTVESIAKGANQAISFADYQTMIAALNALPKGKYNIGQSIYIGTLNVPDIWVSGILDNSVAYTYTTDEDIAEKLKTNNAVQAGHYILSPLETQKVDLTDYVKKTDAAGKSLGLVKDSTAQGASVQNGMILIQPRTNADIDARGYYGAITPKNLDYAFKVAATTNKETWTEEDKANARALFGVKDDLITYGTEDIGVDAPLEDGKLYLVFEE